MCTTMLGELMVGITKPIRPRTGFLVGLAIGIVGLLADLTRTNPPVTGEVAFGYVVQVVTPALFIGGIVWLLGRWSARRGNAKR